MDRDTLQKLLGLLVDEEEEPEPTKPTEEPPVQVVVSKYKATPFPAPKKRTFTRFSQRRRYGTSVLAPQAARTPFRDPNES